jgi:hypothetical protein
VGVRTLTKGSSICDYFISEYVLICENHIRNPYDRIYAVMIMLLSCNANRWKLGRIVEGWLAPCKIPYVIIIGNGAQHHKGGSADVKCTFDEATRELHIDCDDGYDGLSYKVAYGVRDITARFAPDYLIKVDDDIILNPDSLHRFIEVCRGANLDYCGNASMRSLPNYSVHGQDKYKWPENKAPFLLPPNSTCPGPLYFLSAAAMRVIASHMDPARCRFEDVNVSLTLEDHKILATCVPVFTDHIQQFLAGSYAAYHDDRRIHPQNRQ